MFMLRDSLPDLKGKIRFIHAVPNTPSVDIYGNGTLLASNCKFGDLTDYVELAPLEYLIEIYPTGTYDTPIFTENLTLLPGNALTVSIVTNNSRLSLFKLKDSASKAGTNISFLRFIHLSPNTPLISLSTKNGEMLFNQVEYLETTGYYPLSPGSYNFVLSLSGASAINKTISNLSIVPGEFQTIYVLGLLNGEPQLGFLLSKDGRQ